MREPFVPNYREIAGSAIWREQIEPWLEQLYVDALERRAGIDKEPNFPIGKMTIEDFHFWRGWCACLKAVQDTPAEFENAAAIKKEQDTQDAAKRTNSNRDYLARAGSF